MLRPGFYHSAASQAHYLGDLLCAPFSYGLRYLVKCTDPIVPGRQAAMQQQNSRIQEIASRVLCAPLALLLATSTAPLALLGQALKIFANYDKKPFVQIAGSISTESLDAKHKLLSWNLAAMPSVMRRFNNTRPVPYRMHNVVNHIKKDSYDILAFQECFTDEAATILYNGLKKQYPHVVHHVGKNIIGLNSGLMILSRYPISRVEFEAYPGKQGTNALSQKGCLGVVFDLGPGKKAIAVNTHLEAGGGGRKTSAKALKAQQLRQAAKLEKKLRNETLAAGNKIVYSALLGDTNIAHDLQGWDRWPVEKEKVKKVFAKYMTPQFKPAGASTLKEECRILPLGCPGTCPKVYDGSKARVDLAEISASCEATVENVHTVIDRTAGDASDHYPIFTSLNEKR